MRHAVRHRGTAANGQEKDSLRFRSEALQFVRYNFGTIQQEKRRGEF